MDNKIISLSGEPLSTDDLANQGVISILNDALGRAQRGEIEHVVICYCDKSGHPGGIYDGRPQMLLYALARMERRIHRWIDGPS